MTDRAPGRLTPLLFALLALALTAAHAGGFTAELDRTRIHADETITLRLSLDGTLDGNPDLAPLNRDFEVLNQATGTSMSIVNGTTSHTREWTLELAPRRSGRLQVPALSLGGERTQPIAVEVLPPGQAETGEAHRPIFVDTRIETPNPYVQQPFVYRARVLYREQPRRAVLSDPEIEGATLERQGEDQTYAEMVDGERYTVIERRYLVVPQRSGTLTIAGPRLEALMPETQPRGGRNRFADFNDPFGGRFIQGIPDLFDSGGRRVVERGPERRVEVRPQPDGTGANWLPAESVQLSDEWTPSPPHFRVGEPVTRTLVITARGATGAQLPILDPGAPVGLKVYPETPKVEDLPGTSPATLKTLKVALVPTRAGALILPEIRLPWWDTAADQARVAVIPARTVQVEPAAGEPAANAAPAAVAAPAPAPAPAATQNPREPVADRNESPAAGTAGPWVWAAAFFAAAWLATLLWAFRRGQGAPARGQDPVVATARRTASARSARARLRQAWMTRDARAARADLLDWGRAVWPERPPRGLAEIGVRLGDTGGTVAALCERIDRALYAPLGGGWDDTPDWSALEAALAAQEDQGRTTTGAPLPDLYPG
jgi:hypothetical protein